jgi:hypothetical protein
LAICPTVLVSRQDGVKKDHQGLRPLRRRDCGRPTGEEGRPPSGVAPEGIAEPDLRHTDRAAEQGTRRTGWQPVLQSTCHRMDTAREGTKRPRPQQHSRPNGATTYQRTPPEKVHQRVGQVGNLSYGLRVPRLAAEAEGIVGVPGRYLACAVHQACPEPSRSVAHSPQPIVHLVVRVGSCQLLGDDVQPVHVDASVSLMTTGTVTRLLPLHRRVAAADHRLAVRGRP